MDVPKAGMMKVRPPLKGLLKEEGKGKPKRKASKGVKFGKGK